MNLGNFTIKAAEAIQAAQQLAFNSQNPNIETEHILKALLEQQDSPVDYLLKKNNVTINLVDSKLDELISKLPKQHRVIQRKCWDVMQTMLSFVPVPL